MKFKPWQLVSYLSLITIIITLAIFHQNEKHDRHYIEENYNDLKEESLAYKEIPTINRKSEKFVDLFVNGMGQHHTMLGGEALKEYEEAVKGNIEDEMNEDMEIDTSMQDVEILQTSTSVKDNQLVSKVLYRVSYIGMLDDENSGLIDQRILTFLMNIKWKKEKEKYFIDFYEYETINDNIWSSFNE